MTPVLIDMGPRMYCLTEPLFDFLRHSQSHNSVILPRCSRVPLEET